MKYRAVTTNEIKYWKTSVYFLLLDKRGTDLFWSFCEKEFSIENLKFILACKDLQKCSTLQSFDRKSKHIFLEFIRKGATEEINIVSHIKNELNSVFIPLIKQKQMLSPEYTNIYQKAEDHILKLMEKDSYSRFCKSELSTKNS